MIPNKLNQVLSPPHPFLALHKKDFKYIETECPKTSKWYLCNELKSMHNQTAPDCIQHLITTQQRTISCSPKTVSLKKPAYEELDDRHYGISFPTPTKVHLSCGRDLYDTLKGSYLAIIPQRCSLETPHFKIYNFKDRLKGQALKIIDIPADNLTFWQQTTSSAPIFKLNSIKLDHLHETSRKLSMQSPITLVEDSNSSVYHTTIPMYVIVIIVCAIVSVLLYRKYFLRQKAMITPAEPASNQMELQRVFTVPATRVDTNQPPAQFTTSVFNSRCSTGGGVTLS